MAVTAWHGMEYLVSWNCRAHCERKVRRIMGAIHDALDIRTPIVCTPEELMEV
jgi:hypothetical protein